MEWVAIDVHIAGDAVTHRLADRFRLRVAEAAGLLTLAFAGMAQHAQEGELADVTDSQIEAWAMWHGKRGAFAAFVREQLCDEDGTVRAWEKYNGANIREAKAARERMREYRAKKKAERERLRSANGSQNGTANGTRDVRHNMTGHDRTGHDLTEPLEGSASAPPRARRAPQPAWIPRFRERWEAVVGRTTPGVLRRELANAIATHGEQRVLAAIDEYAEAKAGRSMSVKWFAEEIATWVRRASEDDETLVSDGWLTAAGDRETSPNGVAR